MRIDALVEDWDSVKKRWEAWWQQEIYDRVLVAVTAPKQVEIKTSSESIDNEANQYQTRIPTKLTRPDNRIQNKPEPQFKGDWAYQWTNAEFMIQRTLQTIQTTFYGGEALPIFNHNWSAGHALLLGCQPHFAPDTVWVEPAPVAEDGFPHFGEEWRQNPWWYWMFKTTRLAAQASQGRYFMQSLWGNHAGDTLALARGVQKLLLDLIDNPSWVKSAVRQVSAILRESIEVIWELMGPGKLGIEGSLNYVGCWSPGRTMGFDCDISCMISPEDFKTIFLPPLIESMYSVDHRIYHLDGPGAIYHLEALLAIPELHAIQWVPGAGHETIYQWIPLIQRIQNAGKSVAIQAQPEEITRLLEEVRPEGLFITTTCQNEHEARALLKVFK